MSHLRKYLICYDIADQRRLRRVHRTVRDFGVPIQFSVFEAELNKEQFERLLALLEQLIDVAQDHICFYPLSFGFQRINVGGAEMDDGFLFV